MPDESHHSVTTSIPAIDRRHWAMRIGVPFNQLRASSFKALYPFESRLHPIDQYSCHYLDEGEGEPAVMLHGNPTWSFFYRDLIKGLRGEYRCLVLDHLGCGFSEKPQKYRYNLENHVLNLESWLNGVLPPVSWTGGKINLIVHDWGGPIGFGYAVRNPERILRLIVLNSSIFTQGSMPWNIRLCRTERLGRFIVRGLNLFAGEATVRTTVRPLAKKVRNGYLLPYNSWKNRIGIYAFLRDIPLESDSPTHRLLRNIEKAAPERLADKPMLIEWGAKDWCFTPAFLSLWRKNFPHAKVDEHEAGHYLIEDAGKDILDNIRKFLKTSIP
ncbi:MAG: alpha/beta fold hydrolase [Planctomycetota bacterium]|jgi:haloalkane dehalogenase|nr:alpha/beta fold hydrolase [Planctomycetota bacterium]